MLLSYLSTLKVTHLGYLDNTHCIPYNRSYNVLVCLMIVKISKLIIFFSDFGVDLEDLSLYCLNGT